MSVLATFFSLDFVQRALLVGSLISLCAALLGVPLVLKRYSMIGDGLSHVGFAALAIAAALNATDAALYISIPVVVLAAFLLLRISESSHVKGDAAIGVIATLALAIGYIVMYRAGTNIDVSNYMFGNIFTIRTADAWLSIGIAAALLCCFVLFYRRLFAVTFDETFSRAIGVKTGLCKTLIAVLTAVTVVLGMRMMGALLISSLIIFPALTAMRVFGTFRSVTICAAVVSVVNFLLGMVLSYVLETPSGASVVVVDLVVFLLFCGVQRIQCRVKK